ncbi:type II secretion system protein [Candidatus Riflebacteria bacterium]
MRAYYSSTISLIELLVVSVILGILALAVTDLQIVSVARKKESQLKDAVLDVRDSITDFTTELLPQINLALSPDDISNSIATAVPYLRPLATGTLRDNLIQYCINQNYFRPNPGGVATMGVDIITISTTTARLPSVLFTGTLAADTDDKTYTIDISGIPSWTATMSAYLRKSPINPFDNGSWTLYFLASGPYQATAVFGLSNISPSGLKGQKALDGSLLADF